MTSLSDIGIVARDMRIREAQRQVGSEFISSRMALQDLSDGVMMRKDMVVELQLKHEAPMCGRNRVSVVHNIGEPFTLDAQSKERKGLQTHAEVCDFMVATVGAITKSQDVLLSSMLANIGLDSLRYVRKDRIKMVE